MVGGGRYCAGKGLAPRMTGWERTLWKQLRNHGSGFHFRRQHPFGPYILDFYCHLARLCVEIDNDAHEMFSMVRDVERDTFLASYGVLTLRLKNVEVGAETLRCVERIMKLCGDRCDGQHERA